MGTKNILLENQVNYIYWMLGTLLAFSDILPLFSNIDWDQNSYLSFVQKHMGAAFEKCSQHWVANIKKEDIQSGAFWLTVRSFDICGLLSFDSCCY